MIYWLLGLIPGKATTNSDTAQSILPVIVDPKVGCLNHEILIGEEQEEDVEMGSGSCFRMVKPTVY